MLHPTKDAMVTVLHATRFAQTGVPDNATMPSFEPFGQRIPQMGGCHIHRMPCLLRLVFGIERVRHLRCHFESPPHNGMEKVSFAFFFCMGLTARKLKPYFLRKWGFDRPVSISSCAVKKKWTKEETAATLCIRFEIIPSAGSLKLALRASDSQAPDSAE